jgi:mRNA interferase MazF
LGEGWGEGKKAQIVTAQSINKGEANLPRKCVVNITQIKSVDKSSIKEKIGTLSKKRLLQ